MRDVRHLLPYGCGTSKNLDDILQECKAAWTLIPCSVLLANNKFAICLAWADCADFADRTQGVGVDSPRLRTPSVPATLLCTLPNGRALVIHTDRYATSAVTEKIDAPVPAR